VRDTFTGRITFRDSVTWRVAGAVEVADDRQRLHRNAWLRFRAFSPCLRPPRDIFDLAARRGSMEFSGSFAAWAPFRTSPGDSLSVTGTAVFHQPVTGLSAEQPLPLAGSGETVRTLQPVIDTTQMDTMKKM